MRYMLAASNNCDTAQQFVVDLQNKISTRYNATDTVFTSVKGTLAVRVVSRSISPGGVQFDFVWLSARTPHVGASYVW